MPIRLKRIALCTALLLSATRGFGADFDGSKTLICATVDADDCVVGEMCLRDLPESVGVPKFMRVDFVAKTIAGPKRTTQIRFMDPTGDQLLLQGTELGYAWTIAIDKAEGAMSVSFVDREGVYVVFGNCTAP